MRYILRPDRLLLFLLACATAWAQFTLRSSISGVITDASQAVIPSASVTLTDLDRNQVYRAQTNDLGLYTFPNLTPGRYQVAVEKQGFQRTVSEVVTISTQQTARIDLALAVGEITQTVEVTGSGAPLLQTEQGIVGQTVERNLVETLPIKGRNFTAFASLASNISTFPRGNYGGTWSVGGHHLIGGVDYVVGGGGDNGFYMNGANINDNWVGSVSYAPSLEAVSEVKVDVASFSAANGRDVSTLTVATRGGTNDYHGTAYDYFQNSELNAWNPYDKALMEPGQKKSLLQRNQFGGNAGGPIWIPKLFKGRDKAFFFVNYEGTRENRAGEDALYRVPTAAERQGDFSEYLRKFEGDPNYILYDPYSTVIDENGESSRLPVPSNDLRAISGPSGPAIVSEAREMLGIFPESNGYQNPSNPYDLRNYRTFARQGQKNFRLDARADFRLSDNDNFYMNLSRSKGKDNNSGGLIPELTSNLEDNSYLVTANYARVFTPNLTNEFIFAVGKGQMFSVDQNTRDYMAKPDTLRNKYLQNLGQGADFGYHAIGIDGWTDIGFWEIFMASNPTLQFSDNVSLVKGSHSLKMGFNYFRKKEVDWDYIRGVWFGNTFSRAGSVDESRGGDAMADFLMGLPSYINQRYQFTGGEPDLNLVVPYWGFYAEDKWQVSPKLTLNLGMRYDLPIPLYSGNRYGNAMLDFSVPGWQLAIPGRAQGLPLHFVPADKNNFAPRISVAYRLREDFVVRASYGIFYMAGVSNTGGFVLGNAFGSVPGYVGDEYTNARFEVHDDVPYLHFGDIFPPQQSFELGTYPVSTGTGTGYFGYPASVNVNDRKSNVVPYYQRYLFELQKGLGANTVVSLTYLGGRGTKLPYYENVNLPPYRTGWESEDAFNEARPNNTGRFADVSILRHGHNSFYNGVTAKFQRNLSKGLQVLAHYTFSKTVADYNEIVPEAVGQDWSAWHYHRKLGRGEADFSHPHRFVSAVTYQLPWGGNLHPAAKALLWGWNVSSITTFESGHALTVYNGVTSARDGEPDMPNVSRHPNLPRGERGFYRYFDIGAFSAPPQDVKGSAGRGIVRAPGVNNWDISLSKVFRPVERLRVEFRADLLNAFNHTQWGGIDTTFNDAEGSTFGWITWAREPRIVQLGLRVSF